MGWAVSTRQLVGKVDAATCEDVLVVAPARCAVVDGATDKSGLTYRWHGQEVSSGRFAAEAVALELLRHPVAEPAVVVAACSAALRNAVEAQRPGLAPELLPSASVVCLEVADSLIWSVGDAQAAWVDADGHVQVHAPTKLIDAVASQFRAVMHAALAASGATWDGQGDDPGREAILPLLRIQGALANTVGPFGYPVLNGSPIPDDMIQVVALADASTVVLASDGYPSLAPNGVLALEDAEAYLAHALTTDPLCLSELRSTKGLKRGQVSFDDRAWLQLQRQ